MFALYTRHNIIFLTIVEMAVESDYKYLGGPAYIPPHPKGQALVAWVEFHKQLCPKVQSSSRLLELESTITNIPSRTNAPADKTEFEYNGKVWSILQDTPKERALLEALVVPVDTLEKARYVIDPMDFRGLDGLLRCTTCFGWSLKPPPANENMLTP